MKKITEISSNKVKYSDILTNDFRDLAEKELGQLNTAHSFMYLFNRFGSPNYSSKDESKILYEYIFQHKDIKLTIHASYHTHVYFNVFVDERIITKWQKNRRRFLRRLAEKSIKKGIASASNSMVGFKIYDFAPKNLKREQLILIDKEAKKFFSTKDYNFLTKKKIAKVGSRKHEKESVRDFELREKFGEYLIEKFENSLSERDKIKLYGCYFPKLSDLKEIEEQAISAIRNFKRITWVRDVSFDIRGYKGN